MQVHILNGDSLLMHFPDNLWGRTIIAREALIEGDVAGDDLDSFFENRVAFFKSEYGMDETYYIIKSKSEFDQICRLDRDTSVCLWFEEDLFCQVNLWFIAWIIINQTDIQSVSLVRPFPQFPYSFASMSTADLESAFANRESLHANELFALSQLWIAFQRNDFDEMLRIANLEQSKMPFLLAAVKAHIARFPADGREAEPEAMIRKILAENKYADFDFVFREFNKRLPIYGFGDLQFEGIWKRVLNGN